MTENGFFAPIGSASYLLKRMPGLVAWAVLIAVAMASRAVLASSLADGDVRNMLMLQPVLALVPALIGGMLTFFVARAFIAPHTADARPLYGPFVGLFVAAGLIGWLTSSVGRVAIFANEPSQFMMTYGSVFIGSLGAIVTFPFLVRMLTAAAGSREPGLGDTVGFVVREGWCAYVWYATCAILFPALMVYTFANVLGPGNEANDLPGNFVQSAITGTGRALQYMLAVSVAIWSLPDAGRVAETFE